MIIMIECMEKGPEGKDQHWRFRIVSVYLRVSPTRNIVKKERGTKQESAKEFFNVKVSKILNTFFVLYNISIAFHIKMSKYTN